MPGQISELQQSLIHELLPADESGSANVVLEIRAGVGGEWAADFANDLLRMYSQYAASQGWRVEVGVMLFREACACITSVQVTDMLASSCIMQCQCSVEGSGICTVVLASIVRTGL